MHVCDRARGDCKRNPACTVYGDGNTTASLRINMLARPNDTDYCGVYINDVSFLFSFLLCVTCNYCTHPPHLVEWMTAHVSPPPPPFHFRMCVFFLSSFFFLLSWRRRGGGVFPLSALGWFSESPWRLFLRLKSTVGDLLMMSHFSFYLFFFFNVQPSFCLVWLDKMKQ